jgi:hypothetical protein
MPMNPANQATIQAAFNNQVFAQDMVDVQHTPVYDTVTTAANTALTEANSAFFTTVGSGSGKGLNQTNMTQPGRLVAPEAFAIFSYRLRWNENILFADALSLVNNFAWQFSINIKAYQLAPIWNFAAGGGLDSRGLITSTTAGLTQVTNLTSTTNGSPTREAILRLAITLSIENQVNFAAQLRGTSFTTTASASGGTGVIITALLDGLYARAIQ